MERLLQRTHLLSRRSSSRSIACGSTTWIPRISLTYIHRYTNFSLYMLHYILCTYIRSQRATSWKTSQSPHRHIYSHSHFWLFPTKWQYVWERFIWNGCFVCISAAWPRWKTSYWFLLTRIPLRRIVTLPNKRRWLGLGLWFQRIWRGMLVQVRFKPKKVCIKVSDLCLLFAFAFVRIRLVYCESENNIRTLNRKAVLRIMSIWIKKKDQGSYFPMGSREGRLLRHS